MLEDLFCENPIINQYILGNKIKRISLDNGCATEFSFIDDKFAQTFCHILKIQLLYNIKLKTIQRFNTKTAKPINHIIYPMLSVVKHTEILNLLLIPKLDQ